MREVAVSCSVKSTAADDGLADGLKEMRADAIPG